MKRLVLILLGACVLLLVGLVLYARSLPAEHTATSRLSLAQAPGAVWAAITDHPSQIEWRSDLTSVERGVATDGQDVWIEHSEFGSLPLAIVEADGPRRYVTRVADPELAFGGTWTYVLTPREDGCDLQITEEGYVSSSFFRVAAKLMGHHATIDRYLRDLAQKFEETVEPEHVDG